MVSKNFLVTKCLVPIVSQPYVQRSRLTNLLEAGLQRKLTLISAPAGFGKTTLLATWVLSLGTGHSSPQPAPQIAWVSFEPSDNVPLVFWQYVFMALERASPGSMTEHLLAIQSSEPVLLESVLTVFMNARLENPVACVLILDDYQVMTDDAIHRSVAFLLEHLPPQLHVVLLSRSEPPLPLAKLRAKREVSEIGVEDLRCTLEETTSFLRDVMGVELTDESVTQMTARTEGWLVGLQLLGLSLQGRRDPKAVLEELRGSQRYVFDYLMDEVLRQQSEELQRFLLHTSILERLSVPLCNAVLERDDAKALLERLERANLFVIVLDERRQWFRYHHLFREALQTRLGLLDTVLVRGLQLRASEWFAAHGDSLAMAFHAIQAEAWSGGTNVPELERRTQTGYIAAARAHIAATQGDANRAREFAHLAKSLLPKESLLERSAATAAESTAALCDGDIKLAHQLMLQAATLMREAGHPTSALSQSAIAALYWHFQGQLWQAEVLLEQTLAQVVRPGDPPIATACLIYVFQAFVVLERNRLDTALDLILQGIQLAEQLQFDAATELGYTVLGSIHLARGEHAQAQTAIERAIQMPLQNDNLFQQALGVTPIQVRLWVARGQLEQALNWVKQLDSSPPLYAVFARERLNVARVRVLLAVHQPKQVLEILHGMLPLAIKNERWDHVIEMWLLEVLAHDLSANRAAALEVLTQAVVQAEPEGYVRRFLDEGAVIAKLLSQLKLQRPKQISTAYLERLLSAFGNVSRGSDLVLEAPATDQKPNLVQLTERELEVLAFLARGTSNDGIAQRLKVSTHTVKSHVSSLLSKLEAKNRTHAVARARGLGLLENDS